jgi:hypothetical protein
MLKALALSLALAAPFAQAECTQEETEKRIIFGASTVVDYIVGSCMQQGYFTIDIGRAQPVVFLCTQGQMSMEDSDEATTESDVPKRSRG